MVKPGYKQTEVGVIPEDWEDEKLGKLADVCMCKRIFAEQTTENGEIPFFKIGTFGKEADAFISRSLYEEFKRRFSYPQKGDVLISAAGTLGRSVIFDGKDSYFQDSNIVWLDVDKDKLSNEYLYHYYKVIQWASSEGSTIARLYNGIICDTHIALPQVKEQEKIAGVLSEIDKLILIFEKQISKKKAIKQGAMQELLTGKRRLPGFSGKWKQRPFSDACEICARMVDPTQTEYANLPHIGNESIEKFTGRITHYNKVKEDQLISGKYLFSSNDVLYGKINPHFAKAAFPMFEGLCSADMYPISCKKDILPEYLLYILLSTEFTNYTVSLSKRSGIPKVNREELADYMMLLPSLDEQKEIANVLCGIDLEIDSLIQKLAKYRQIKQGMMQQLLTGKIRLV